MIKQKLNFVMIMAFIAIIATSCNNNAKYPGFVQYKETDLFYKLFANNTDTTVAHIGDMMSVFMTYRTMDDSVFGQAQSEPYQIPMVENTYEGDVFDALSMLHPGDSATFIMNTDSFFIKTFGAPRPEFLDSGSTFYLDVHLVDVKSKEQMEKEAQEQAVQMQANENHLITQYLTENNISIDPDDLGLYMIEGKKGKGAKVEVGKFIDVDIIATALAGDKFIDTYVEGKPYTLEVGTAQLGMGFEQAILKMREGGKLTLLAPSSQAFGERGIQGYIPPYSPIVYEIEVLKVISADQMKAKQKKEREKAEAAAAKLQKEEQAKIDSYVKANNITATPTASGLIMTVVQKGTGERPQVGDRVKVHYSGYLLNGKKFDSSLDRGQPFEFVVGQRQVIPGWDEALLMMQPGEKVKIILPSRIAYGERGAGADIPPYAPLMFEVELLEIVK